MKHQEIATIIAALEKAIGAGIAQTYANEFVSERGAMCATSVIYWACTGVIPGSFDTFGAYQFYTIAEELKRATQIDFMQSYHEEDHLLEWMTKKNDTDHWSFADFLSWFAAEPW